MSSICSSKTYVAVPFITQNIFIRPDYLNRELRAFGSARNSNDVFLAINGKEKFCQFREGDAMSSSQKLADVNTVKCVCVLYAPPSGSFELSDVSVHKPTYQPLSLAAAPTYLNPI